MKKNIADKIQDLQFFGEFGGINPSISDSSSFTYLKAETMESVFVGAYHIPMYNKDARHIRQHVP